MLMPVMDVTNEAIRCNQLNPGGGGSTSTLPVEAGRNISWFSSPGIYHPGPVSVYMAKVPTGQTAATFDGSGGVWFKIYQEFPSYRNQADVFGSHLVWASQCIYSQMILDLGATTDYFA